MKILILLYLFMFSQISYSKEVEKEIPFDPFYSIRTDVAGGGSNMKYQNKTTSVIKTSESKKIMNIQVRLVRHSLPNFRWYLGVLLEDYSFKDINMTNEMSISGVIGMTYSFERLHLTGEFLGYQHMEFNSSESIFRKFDPAVRAEWKYDLVNFDKNVLGLGQSYLITLPISDMTSDPYVKNTEPDYDVTSQIYYRQVYIKNSLEFYLQHNFKVIENYYYRGELNNLNFGVRLAFPFQ